MARLHRVEYSHSHASRMCADLDLEVEALNRPTREYSKGMSQKLGLVATFLSGKELYVLDEPMSGLDPKARVLVKRRMREHLASGGGVFLSTHTLSDAEEFCDRLAILTEVACASLAPPGNAAPSFMPTASSRHISTASSNRIRPDQLPTRDPPFPCAFSVTWRSVLDGCERHGAHRLEVHSPL